MIHIKKKYLKNFINYKQILFNMSKKRQNEIIKLLEETINNELSKFAGGNSETITQLTKKLEKVKMWEKKKDE